MTHTILDVYVDGPTVRLGPAWTGSAERGDAASAELHKSRAAYVGTLMAGDGAAQFAARTKR